MIDKVLRLMAALAGILFLVIGLRWVIDPRGAALELGMPLLDGIGRSTQIGDMAAFFLTLGSLVLAGVTTLKKVWFYPPMMLLGFAAIVRVVAWLVHGAELAVSLIVVELVSTAVLFCASIRICEEKPDEVGAH